MLSHGAAAFCQDRLFYQSDFYRVPVCRKCGFLAEPAAPKGTLTLHHDKHFCQYCRSNDHVETVQMPYCMKLFIQEMLGLHMRPRLTLED